MSAERSITVSLCAGSYDTVIQAISCVITLLHRSIMSTLSTRKRILEAALRLFNESGTATVSTNHIAAEAGISPGNLYYHYRNKEEIIRALVEDMLADYRAMWQPPVERRLGLEDLHALVRGIFEVHWRYRFFGRERVALTRHDETLGQRLRANYLQRIQQQKAFIQHLIEADVLRHTKTEAELDEILIACWVVADHWLIFLESTRQSVSYEQFQDGIQIITRIIQPYLMEG
jgi:AcrR family transcriptional regulator